MVGILITPLIASISEDAMRAVPRGLREGAYAMGATKFEVVRKVVFPAAALGDHGLDHPGHEPRGRRDDGRRPRRRDATRSSRFNPLESVQTMTAFIVQISLGETPQGSIQFQSLFAVGARSCS